MYIHFACVSFVVVYHVIWLPIGSYYQSQYPLGYLILLQVNCPFACKNIVVVVVVDHCMVVCLKHH